MKKILDESELLTRLSALPGEMAPRHDAWPQIATRIAHPASDDVPGAHRSRIWPLATAASFIVILAAGLLLKNQWNSSGLSVPVKDSAASAMLAPGKSYYSGSPTSGELEYQAALREFMALNTMPGASEEPKSKWMEQGWEALRQVELELASALRNEPDNDFLNSRLAALRARQIELLQQIAALDSASWRNNI
jgi:hypothetical protein